MKLSTNSLAALIGLTAICLTLAPWARADVGPRPPIQTQEVNDPEKYLTMRDETVKVEIVGHRAHVVADFHFETPQPLWRKKMRMRLGFPELVADQALLNFKVLQASSFGDPDGQSSADWTKSLSTVGDIEPQEVGTGLSNGLKARWKTWPLLLTGSNGAPMKIAVRTRVTYDQDLTPTGPGTWRFTYVLRSGAPWTGPIGAAAVTVDVPKGTILSSTPKGAATAHSANWSFKDFEPAEDVVVTIKG